MAPTVPVGEPIAARAGDTWTWDIFPGDFPSSEGWTISYAFAGNGVLTWSSSYVAANGAGYRITIPTSATGLTPGNFKWACFATLSGARYDVNSGVIEVLRDLATATGTQAQTHDEQMVALLEAALILRASPTSTTGGENFIEQYGLNARTVEVQKMSTAEIMTALAKYRARVAQQRRGGLGVPVPVRFVQPA